MAEPIFQIAQRFQNKIEEDLGYANRQKEAFRDQYRADKKLPSELSGYTLEDMANQFGIAERKQNDATNLATSGAQADLGLMTANDNKSAFAGEADLREQERAKKLAEFSRIAEIDSLTLDSQIKKLQSDAELEPDRAKKEKLDLETEILKTEIAIRQAPTEAVVQELKLKRQAMEEQYALSNAPAEQAVTAEQAKADLATAKTNVIAAEANLASAPDEVARAEAQRQLDKAKLDYANKTLGEEQALSDQTRKNETATAKDAEISADEQRAIDRLTREAELADLRTKASIAPTIQETIIANAKLKKAEAEHALLENKDVEESRQAAARYERATRTQRQRTEALNLSIQEATSNNSIIDLTADKSFSDLRASIPEYDLMPKGDRYIALFDAADAAKSSPETIKKLNAAVLKDIPKELAMLDAMDEYIAVASSGATTAQTDRAFNKMKASAKGVDVRMIQLAIDRNILTDGMVSQEVMAMLESSGDDISGALDSAAKSTTSETEKSGEFSDTSVLAQSSDYNFFQNEGPRIEALVPQQYKGVFTSDVATSKDAEDNLKQLLELKKGLQTDFPNPTMQKYIAEIIERRSKFVVPLIELK